MPHHEGFVTWCTSCQWNVDPDPSRRQDFFERLAASQADRLARRLFESVRAHPQTQRRGILVTSLAWMLAIAVHLMTLALVAAGVYVFLGTGLVLVVRLVLLVALLGLAVAVQPCHRGRRRSTTPSLDKSSAPQLLGLIDEVAAAIGAPAVSTVVVSTEFNASYFRLQRGKPATSLLDKLLIADACRGVVTRTVKFGR